MKKKILVGVLAILLLSGTPVKAMGWLDVCATWIAASYAYHGWCYWTNAHQGKPASVIIKELKICLEALKEKVSKEQQDIEECQKTLSHLQKELDYYKKMLGLRATMQKGSLV